MSAVSQPTTKPRSVLWSPNSRLPRHWRPPSIGLSSAGQTRQWAAKIGAMLAKPAGKNSQMVSKISLSIENPPTLLFLVQVSPGGDGYGLVQDRPRAFAVASWSHPGQAETLAYLKSDVH